MHVQPCHLPSLQEDHLEWLRQPRGSGHGHHSRGEAVQLPL